MLPISHTRFDRLAARVLVPTHSSSCPSKKELKRMGAHEKVTNKIDDVAGKAKEALGKVTDDHGTEAEGKLDQAKASLKDAGHKVKDAFKD
jgi:uncharacterized protein YjbJ (UPF0337 family)